MRSQIRAQLYIQIDRVGDTAFECRIGPLGYGTEKLVGRGGSPISAWKAWLDEFEKVITAPDEARMTGFGAEED
jgi:hypothetical protein